MLPAIVLTAGFGTRLDPLTRLVAKPAVPLGDRALIERVLAWLRGEGVRDAVLNLHHLPATITGIVGDGTHLGLSVRYSWESPILGSAGGPRRALPLLDADTFAIVNGDTLCEIALAPMIEAHRRSGAAVTLAVVPNPAPDHYSGIAADAAGAVTGFVPRGPGAAGTWHLVGVQIVSARAFAPLPDGQPAESVAGLYRQRLVDAPGSIRIHRASAAFLDVGTPRDYLEAWLRVSGADGAAAARRIAIWPTARVEPGADLDNAIVIGGARVPADVRASGVIIAPAAVARPAEAALVRGGLAFFPIVPREP